MSDDGVSMIGRNVARYRKAAKMSGEDLADAAQTGLSRSVIANLENGRKDDVTVKQLIALSKALGVPPVALMVDIHDPGGEPEFHMDRGEVPEYDFDKAELTFVPSRFRNIEAALWIGGSLSPRPSLRTPAQADAYGALNAIDVYQKAFLSWLMTAQRYRRLLAEEAEGVIDEHGEKAYLEGMLETQSEYVVSSVRGLLDRGVKVDKTLQYVEDVMRRLDLPFDIPLDVTHG